MFNLNKENLSIYSNHFKNIQPHQQHQEQHQRILTLVSHIDESLAELRKKTETTVSNINDIHEKIQLLKQNSQVIAFQILEKEKGDKRKRDLVGSDNIEPNTKKRKNNSTKDVESTNSDDSESEFEEERNIENEEMIGMEDDTIFNSREIDDIEDEVISREISYDEENDRKHYEEAEYGEYDESIATGSRIQVYWKGEDLWYKGTVRGWDEVDRVYLIDYDNEESLEPLGEHLTGPSAERWDYIRATRQYRKKTLKGQAMEESI